MVDDAALKYSDCQEQVTYNVENSVENSKFRLAAFAYFADILQILLSDPMDHRYF